MGLFDSIRRVVGGESTTAESAAADHPELLDARDLDVVTLREHADDVAGEVEQLDFSLDSLAQFDAAIDAGYDDELHTADTPELYDRDVVRFGAYLGEVIVRVYGGEWTREDGWGVAMAGPDDTVTVSVFEVVQRSIRSESVFAPVVDRAAETVGLDADGATEPHAPADATTVDDAADDSSTAGDDGLAKGTPTDEGEAVAGFEFGSTNGTEPSDSEAAGTTEPDVSSANEATDAPDTDSAGGAASASDDHAPVEADPGESAADATIDDETPTEAEPVEAAPTDADFTNPFEAATTAQSDGAADAGEPPTADDDPSPSDDGRDFGDEDASDGADGVSEPDDTGGGVSSLVDEAEPDRAATADEEAGDTDSEDVASLFGDDGSTDTPGSDEHPPAEPDSDGAVRTDDAPVTGSTDDIGPIDDAEPTDDSTLDPAECDGLRAEYAEEAAGFVSFWNERDLDYTPESLARLDALVAAEWDAERFEDATFGDEATFDDRAFTSVSTELGSYFGEVLVRDLDAEWSDETDMDSVVVDGPDGPLAIPVFRIAGTSLKQRSMFVHSYESLLSDLGR